MPRELYSSQAEVDQAFKNFKRVKGERTKLYLGVELEVNAISMEFNSQFAAGMKVHETLKDNIIIKPEGVNNGFEIVTVPATLRYHREKLWDGFFPGASEYLGGDGGCGLHVHFSRNAVDDKTLARVIYFYHEPANNKFMTEIAGRPVSKDAHWCKAIKKTWDESKPSVTIDEALPGAPHPENKQIQMGRGAICVSTRKSGKTCEVRIFQSTPTQEHVFSCIEFVVAIIHWCKETPLTEPDIREGNFIQWFVDNNRKLKYPYLYQKLMKLGYVREFKASMEDAIIVHNRAREDVA